MGNELFFSLKTGVFKRLAIIIILALAIASVDMALHDYDNVQIEIAPLKMANGVYYKVGEVLHGELEHLFFTQPEALNRLKSYISALGTNEGYPYYISSAQGVGRQDTKFPRTFYQGFEQRIGLDNSPESYSPMFMKAYEEGNLSTMAFQINHAVIRDFPLKLYDGRVFSQDDFIYHNNRIIPVLMGAEYAQYHKMGDRFTGKYLTTEQQFEVIGVLAPGQFLPFEDYPIYLDSAILMPSFDCPENPQQEEELFFQQALYLDKATGYFRVEDESGLPDLVRHMENITQQFGLFEPIFYRINSDALRLMKLAGSSRLMLMRSLTLMMTAFSVLLFLLFHLMNTIKQLHRYSLMMLCGISRKKLMRLNLHEITLIYFTAAMIGYIIEIFVLPLPTGRYALIAAAGFTLILLAAMPAFVLLRRFNSMKHIKETD